MSHGCNGITPGTECPKCSRYTVISLNQNLWKCLNCDFSKDFSEEEDDDEEGNNAGILTIIGGFIIAGLCLLGI